MQLPIRAKMFISGSLLVFTIIETFLVDKLIAVPVAIGMLFSLHGDACMARHPFLYKRYGETLPFGIGSFLIAHVFYVFAFFNVLRIAHGNEYLTQNFYLLFGAGFVLYAVGTIAVWVIAVRNASDLSALIRIGALTYGLALSIMAAFALTMAGTMGGFYWISAVGGVLFLVSDAIIALSDFGKFPIKNADSWIWLTYVLAQCCIVTLPLIHGS